MNDVFLKVLNAIQGNQSVVLVGGQCLLVWAIHYESQGHKNLQVATEDIDILGTKETVQNLERILNTRATIPKFDDATPEIGVLRVPIGQNQKLTIDVLSTIAGLSKHDVEKYSATLKIRGMSINVLNPVGMLKSRMANVITLRRTNQHSLQQLKASTKIVGHFVQSLLEQGYRYARRDINDILHLAEHREGVALYKNFDIDILEFIPKKHKNYPDGFVDRHLKACFTRIERKRKT